MSRAGHNPTMRPRDMAACARWVVYGGGGGRVPSHTMVQQQQAANAERLQAYYVAREALAVARCADEGRPYKTAELMRIAGGALKGVDYEKWPYPPVQCDPLTVLRLAVHRGFVRVVQAPTPAANGDTAVPATLPAAPHDGTGAPVEGAVHVHYAGDERTGYTTLPAPVGAQLPAGDTDPGTWGMLTHPTP